MKWAPVLPPIVLVLTTPFLVRSESLVLGMPLWALVSLGFAILFALVTAVFLQLFWDRLAEDPQSPDQ